MTKSNAGVIGRGVYGAGDALRLLNFDAALPGGIKRNISRQTVARWLRGYEFQVKGENHRSAPLWKPDYANDAEVIEVSFRDLIELRFVRAFRDAGVALPTIRQCFQRAVEMVRDERPFSTRRFQTDGRTIFLDITQGVDDVALVDLKHRQTVFRSFVAPSLKDLEFDAEVVARWFPLGGPKRTVMIDPTYAFGRPISAQGHVPTGVLANAPGSRGRFGVLRTSMTSRVHMVRDAVTFEQKLAA